MVKCMPSPFFHPPVILTGVNRACFVPRCCVRLRLRGSKGDKAQPLPFQLPTAWWGSRHEISSCRRSVCFHIALALDSSYPSQEVWGRSPAWEGLLTQLGLGVPAWMASSPVAFSSGATVHGTFGVCRPGAGAFQ